MKLLVDMNLSPLWVEFFDPDKEAEGAHARDLWVPAVNHEGAFGRWAVYDVDDPWNAKTELRALLARLQERAA